MAYRVLLIVEAASAGVGRHVIDLATGLADRGETVHVVYSPTRIDNTFTAAIERLHRVHWHPLRLARGPRPGDLAAVRFLNRLAAIHGPFDVIHGHSSKGGALARLMRHRAAAVCYTPHCIYTMDPTVRGPVKAIAWAVERSLALRTGAIIAVGPGEYEHLQRAGFSATRIHYIPNGIGPIEFEPRDRMRDELGVPADGTVVGFIGRLAHQKNPLMLLRAFAQLPGATAPDGKLWLAMVGTGPLETPGRELAQSLGIADRVRWGGYRTAATSFAAFDLLAMPSLYEGMAYVPLEALAAGLPVVSTDVSGVREAVADGETGLIVQTQDANDFAVALQRLVEDVPFRNHCSAAALERAKRFTAAEMVERTVEIYAAVRGPKLSANPQA